jgi:hypothetical protein
MKHTKSTKAVKGPMRTLILEAPIICPRNSFRFRVFRVFRGDDLRYPSAQVKTTLPQLPDSMASKPFWNSCHG